MRGEKIYEANLDVTGETDYGIPLNTVLSGQVNIPAQGVRIDVSFQGRATGRLAGTVRGVDYVRMRARSGGSGPLIFQQARSTSPPLCSDMHEHLAV